MLFDGKGLAKYRRYVLWNTDVMTVNFNSALDAGLNEVNLTPIQSPLV